ncbi:hypothetical protein HG536_0A06840 [Torulaspora globosa]|uniref:Aminoacyl-transfer RNA synthetases class-II family profile domain-containing protein n=1 Tax=Torulaspora globosa TaxID=48254 RepID=A0A7G3ZBI3_9SACH|nr:uncharacterized protein HG536_0A06840 [Torulaspora globosa]QLL30869.1 hypothetical protein HG536_0A06840 [Torulaspora globosa]
MMLGKSVRLVHTIGRLLKDLPPSESTLGKFRFEKDVVSIKELAKLSEGAIVNVNGWIDKKPVKVGKKLSFCTLRDTAGNKIQLVDSELLLKGANVEDAVQVKGSVMPKRQSTNDDAAGFEIKLTSITTLNPSNKKPSQLQDFKSDGIYPPEFRFLQLRLPKYQNLLKKRYEITKSVRKCLEDYNFTEIETPILFKSTPEGAREFLVPTRKTADGNKKPTFYALPQSPQQYKQLLMASGVHRYFQLARCFRDEDLRADRQPEFTQIDMEMAFADGEDVMRVVQDLVTATWNHFSSNGDLLTLDNRGKLVSAKEHSIKRISYKQAMTEYGIDKPDLRAPDLKIRDLSEFKAFGYINKDFPVFEVLILKNAFDPKSDGCNRWSFLSNPDNYNSRVPIVVPIKDNGDETSWFEKFLPITAFENPKLVTKFLNLKKGDIVCGSTRQHARHLFENPTPLGRLRQLVLQNPAGKELYQQTSKDVVSWITDFPLFSPVEISSDKKLAYPQYETHAITSTHHPFTMVRHSDYQNLREKPLQCLGQHYDLVVSGVEIGGGSTRVHDPALQDFIFEDILNINNAHELFGHLLNAFEMGTPPHAGFAIGFDRMCAMLCGSESIRDVIAFPKSVTGSDLVVGSPTAVAPDVLKAYNVDYAKSG